MGLVTVGDGIAARGMVVGIAVAAATGVAIGGGVLVGETAVLSTVGISVTTIGRVTVTGSCSGRQPIKPITQMNKRNSLGRIRKKEKADCGLLLKILLQIV